jgi:murein hydrolase activator
VGTLHATVIPSSQSLVLRCACVAVFLAGAAAPGLAQTVSAQASNGKTDSTEVRDKLRALRLEIAAINAVLSAKASERDGAASELQAVELAIAASARAVIELNTRLANSTLELEALNAQEQALSARLAQERSVLAKLLRSAYAIGQLEQVKLALSQEKVAKVGRVLAYHTYVNQARISAIEAIQANLTALSELRVQIAAKQVELNGLIAAEAEKSSDLAAKRLARTELYARLGLEVQTGEARLSELNADQQRLNNLLSRLSDLLSDIPKVLPNVGAFARLKGELPSPLSAAVSRLSEFGSINDVGRAATGVVFAAPLGTQVRAIAGGRVAFADWLRGFGLLMIIDHGDGYLSLYGQCETLLRAEGDWIDAGTLIASSGQLEALGPGLYFELRQRGRAVNPAAWLK